MEQKQINPKRLEAICEGYESFLYDKYRRTCDVTDHLEIEPTKAEIEEFSKIFHRYINRSIECYKTYAGLYLTGLVEMSRCHNFIIDLKNLNKRGIILNYLGCDLGDGGHKKLIVNGNAGDNVGHNAKNSEIVINGNIRDCGAYEVYKCKITINGNVEGRIGDGARHSTIIINGDTKGNIGICEEDCKIYVKGKFGGIILDEEDGSRAYKWIGKKWKRLKEEEM